MNAAKMNTIEEITVGTEDRVFLSDAGWFWQCRGTQIMGCSGPLEDSNPDFIRAEQELGAHRAPRGRCPSSSVCGASSGSATNRAKHRWRLRSQTKQAMSRRLLRDRVPTGKLISQQPRIPILSPKQSSNMIAMNSKLGSKRPFPLSIFPSRHYFFHLGQC